MRGAVVYVMVRLTVIGVVRGFWRLNYTPFVFLLPILGLLLLPFDSPALFLAILLILPLPFDQAI